MSYDFDTGNARKVPNPYEAKEAKSDSKGKDKDKGDRTDKGKQKKPKANGGNWGNEQALATWQTRANW